MATAKPGSSRENIFELMQNLIQEDAGETDDASEEEGEDDDDEDYELPDDYEDSESDSDLDAEVASESDEETQSDGENESGAEQPQPGAGAPSSYEGKDGTTWKASPVLPSSRTRASNIVREKPGPKASPQSITEAFELYFDDDIVEVIVDATNQEAARQIGKKWAKKTDAEEVKAFFGLLLIAGALKAKHLSYDLLWSTSYGPPIFRATMSLKRFKALLALMRFDDKSTRAQRRATDKLAPIRDVWQRFLKKLEDNYTPGANITSDEQLVPFRGRCPFIQYIPSKPDKYGFKIFWECDSRSFYPLRAKEYLGKEGNQRQKGLGKKLILQLREPYQRSNRNITADNFFCDLELALELKAKGLTLVGTLRKNKRCLPQEFLPSRTKEEGSSVFGFHAAGVTLVSYTPKKNKSVILLSSMHHDDAVDPESGKPEIIEYYNSTKGGVDSLDQLVHAYMCKRQTKRWPMAFFLNMLDVGCVAALIVWLETFPEWHSNR